MVEPVTINGHKIGKGYPPYIVAEISASHNGELSQAITLINKAKKAGTKTIVKGIRNLKLSSKVNDIEIQ